MLEGTVESFKHPRPINMHLVDAQQARRILDRLVGYNISPILWRKVKKGLSAGRVQSVALRLIIDRENEIKNFVPEEYWTIEGKFEKEVLRPWAHGGARADRAERSFVLYSRMHVYGLTVRGPRDRRSVSRTYILLPYFLFSIATSTFKNTLVLLSLYLFLRFTDFFFIYYWSNFTFFYSFPGRNIDEYRIW